MADHRQFAITRNQRVGRSLTMLRQLDINVTLYRYGFLHMGGATKAPGERGTIFIVALYLFAQMLLAAHSHGGDGNPERHGPLANCAICFIKASNNDSGGAPPPTAIRIAPEFHVSARFIGVVALAPTSVEYGRLWARGPPNRSGSR